MYQRFTNSEVRAHNNCPMESRDHFKNGVNPKNHRSRGNFKNDITKRMCFLALFVFVGYFAFAQFQGGQLSFGTIPKQEYSIVDVMDISGKAITFNATYWYYGETRFAPGIGAGLGIRNYKGIPSEYIINSDDPYKKNMTRFDIHVSPALTIGDYRQFVKLFVYPQLGLWYAGMSNQGPKVNGTVALCADLIAAGSLAFGITYRVTSSRLVSTDWNVDTMANSYILIKPAVEFRLSLFFLEGFWEAF